MRFLEKHHGLDFKKAVQTITVEDRRRINLYRKFGREDYDSPAHYHLVINTGRLSLEKSAGLMCALTGACKIPSE